MLNFEQKKKLVSELTEALKSARGIVFSQFQGLKTRDSQDLRALLRREKVSHKVVKITLLRRILQRLGVDAKALNFQVPLAVSFSADDEVAPARILHGFAKTHEQLKILAGVLDKKFIDAMAVKQLATLPGKQELRGRLVSTIAGPLRGFVGVLSGNMRQLVYVLNAIKSTKS